MNEQEILEKIITCIKETAPDIETDKLTLDSDIKMNLKMDSFQMITLITVLEEKFKVKLMDESLFEVVTLKDIVELIKKEL